MRVLIVDDEAIIRFAMVAMAEEWGYEVFEAGNAEEALAVLRGSSPIDVMITDVNMPGTFDGLELSRLVMTHWPETRIIVISGRADMLAAQVPEGVLLLAKPVAEPLLRAATNGLGAHPG